MSAHRNKGWLIPYLRQEAGAFGAAWLCGLLAVCCAAGLLFSSGYLISRSALRPDNILLLYVPIATVRAFGAAKTVLQYAERLAGHSAALRALSRMRVRLYRSLEAQALTLRERAGTGELLGLLAEDIERLQHVYLRFLLPVLSALAAYGAVVALIGRLDASFAVTAVLYGIFLFGIVPFASLIASKRRRRLAKAARNGMYRELTDTLFGLHDWILSGRTGELASRLRRSRLEAVSVERLLRNADSVWQWVTACSAGAAVLLAVHWAGGLYEAGRIEVSWIAALVLVVIPLLDIVAKAFEAVGRLPDHLESAERLRSVEAQGAAAVRLTPGTPAEAPSVDAFAGIELAGAGYRYPGSSQWVLRNLSLRVPSGGRVALLGRSGAGKSTLLGLILGELRPTEGSVTVNGVRADGGGEDGAASLVSVLNQEPYLFDATIASNIRLGRPDADDEEVREAARHVGLDSMIRSLPDGYRTRMLEAGSRFSGGERQRIALARILLQNRPVVLLDEPATGLDPLTEYRLIRTIFQVLEDKTLLWVTHHLTGMEAMDEILFLDRGSIGMRGPHERLLRECPQYRRLYALDRMLPIPPAAAGRGSP